MSRKRSISTFCDTIIPKTRIRRNNTQLVNPLKDSRINILTKNSHMNHNFEGIAENMRESGPFRAPTKTSSVSNFDSNINLIGTPKYSINKQVSVVSLNK